MALPDALVTRNEPMRQRLTDRVHRGATEGRRVKKKKWNCSQIRGKKEQQWVCVGATVAGHPSSFSKRGATCVSNGWLP